MLTCRELIDFLDDYVAGALPAERRHEFEAHLSICPPCVDYLRTYRGCIELSRAVIANPDGPPPPGVPDALVAAILSALARRPDPPCRE